MNYMRDDLRLMIEHLRFILLVRKVAGFVALCICSSSLVLISQRFSGNDCVLRATLTLVLHTLVQVLISRKFREQCDVICECFWDKHKETLRKGGDDSEPQQPS